MRLGRPGRVLITGAGVTLLAAGCSSAVPMDAAPSAADPRCSDVMVLLPKSLGERQERDTTAQATLAWAVPGEGSGDAVTLTCGVESPAPTIDPCTTVGGVDWVAGEHAQRIWYTSYGRSPAVRVSIPADGQDGTDQVLAGVAGSLAGIPAERSCS